MAAIMIFNGLMPVWNKQVYLRRNFILNMFRVMVSMIRGTLSDQKTSSLRSKDNPFSELVVRRVTNGTSRVCSPIVHALLITYKHVASKFHSLRWRLNIFFAHKSTLHISGFKFMKATLIN